MNTIENEEEMQKTPETPEQEDGGMENTKENRIAVVDLGDEHVDAFDRFKELEKKRNVILKGRKKKCELHLNDPFILKFMKRDAVRPKMPEIGQVLSKRLNLTQEEDVYLLPTTERMEEKIVILPKRPSSRASAPSNRKRRVLDTRTSKEMFGRTATATSIRPQTASQRKLKSIQSIFSRPAISARRIRIKRG